MVTTLPATEPIVLSGFDDAKEAYRSKDLRQALYDEGDVIMADVLVNLHGAEHRERRRVENRLFRRDTFERYERDLFPGVVEQTLAPYLKAGRADLVPLGHELMLNLSALTAGIDRPLGTAAETRRLQAYMMVFIEGATLAHSTGDKAEQRRRIAAALADWDREFLQPSIARRRALIARARAGGEIGGAAAAVRLPRDVLTTLLENQEELGLADDTLRREVAFFLLAGAHTTGTAFVRAIDHTIGWLDAHPEDASLIADDRLFVQRCIHETLRLNPSSPISRRRALAPVRLRSGTEIPEGAEVVIDLHTVNRDREVFGDDADEFNPRRPLPPGVAPFGLSFAVGMHVCIGQDLAAGVVPNAGAAPEDHLSGLLTGAVQRFLSVGVRRDPASPPERDQNTARPYWGRYPVLFGEEA
jgi:cytochrome P450